VLIGSPGRPTRERPPALLRLDIRLDATAPASARSLLPAQLHFAWVDFFEFNYRANREIAYRREYLLVVGERR